MNILSNISLKPYNTFGIDIKTKHFVSVSNLQELKNVLNQNNNSPRLFLGGGSNILFTQDFNGLVIHLNLKGIEVLNESSDQVNLKIQAGENWHELVLWCLDRHYGGIENLSLIPGNVGTAPIQNIGAYGVELKDVFVSCEALNLKTLEVEYFSNSDCKFGYRDSIFKGHSKDKYVILNVALKLSKTNHLLRTDYGAIKSELENSGIKKPTIQDVSKVVIKIRQSKLPDPKNIGNSGSFFKNPIISNELYSRLKIHFPDIPAYPVSESEVKIPAGWLIEKAGFKGKRLGNYGVHEHQALVLVNYGGAQGEDIHNLAMIIKNTIKRLFDITLIPEVNII